MNLDKKEATVSILRMKSVSGGDRPRAWKRIEVLLAHLFREFLIFFHGLGAYHDAKHRLEAANFTEGSLTISLLDFWIMLT